MSPLNLNRMPMPAQDPQERNRNFNEVALGYTWEMAKAEADRCILCPRRPCVDGCPVHVDIPEFIKALRQGDMPEAVTALRRKNNLPAICGRVCPQETQCEARCVIGKRGGNIAIGRLERFVADWELSHPEERLTAEKAPPSGQRVAVVGAGPAGLTCAADLAKAGHQVTIFEALHLPGGVLAYGIPEFRLPKSIVEAEVNYVKSLGVEIVLDAVVGKAITVDEFLQDGYQAVFLGTGAGLPSFQGIPGENYNGVYSANEYLTRVNLMKSYLFPEYDTPVRTGKKVAVIGAGNVAIDAARCAKRMGADEVYIVYRRSRAEIPARHEEVEHAEEEGIVLRLLTLPKRILGNEDGWVAGMECMEMELGEPDASGRRRPVEKRGTEFVMDVDTVIVAIGTTPNPLVPTTTQGLETTRQGTVVVTDEEAGKTTKEATWAGGDVVTGAATVISAMGAGKRAAAAIDEYLRNL